MKKSIRMPSTIGNNASKHFPSDFFKVKNANKAGTAVHNKRDDLQQHMKPEVLSSKVKVSNKVRIP